MIKKLGFLCNKCRSIIYDLGECSCGNIAIISNNRTYHLYTNEDNYTLVDCYVDVNNNIVKFYPNRLELLGETKYVSKNFIRRIKP